MLVRRLVAVRRLIVVIAVRIAVRVAAVRVAAVRIVVVTVRRIIVIAIRLVVTTVRIIVTIARARSTVVARDGQSLSGVAIIADITDGGGAGESRRDIVRMMRAIRRTGVVVSDCVVMRTKACFANLVVLGRVDSGVVDTIVPVWLVRVVWLIRLVRGRPRVVRGVPRIVLPRVVRSLPRCPYKCELAMDQSRDSVSQSALAGIAYRQ